ncbi:TPA: glycosyltransferase family 2 protein [Escherichia coli]|nr:MULTISPECIES: glycosyltransferase family 2 protein [Escherichia]EFC2598014.1 glycosyltransferase [Escherichia coli]EFI0097669.1 glycosyltransferase [Escherichia coli]EFQ2022489.1 glycosyltransferase [Escherichia coli]EGK3635540.1 glycosyltransferase [Escherichia coli]EGQ7456936.1 glycosyltransferase [Escherichia coli]
MSKKIIAIVVTYNRVKLLNKVIDALLLQTYKIDKIIVVDNNSSDGTKELINSYSQTEIIYHNTGANLGGAGGFYQGFVLASSYEYDCLWLMDDDLMPNPTCLEELIRSKCDGIVQPLRYNLDGTCAELSPLSYDLNTIFKLKPKGISIRDYIQRNGALSEPIAIEAIPFEGPLIHKRAVEVIGLPEPRFFIFCDDIDYAIRAKKSGVRIICEPRAKATRLLVNNQTNDMLSWKGYFMLRNLFHLYKKHGENNLVKLKPLILACGYTLLCVLKLRFKQVPVIINALRDSAELKNNEVFKPK